MVNFLFLSLLCSMNFFLRVSGVNNEGRCLIVVHRSWFLSISLNSIGVPPGGVLRLTKNRFGMRNRGATVTDSVLHRDKPPGQPCIAPNICRSRFQPPAISDRDVAHAWRLAVFIQHLPSPVNVLGIWPPPGISPHYHLPCHVKQYRGSATSSRLPRFGPDRPKQCPRIAERWETDHLSVNGEGITSK
ncbi:hypothetical protein H4582DRAFT_2029965 [Lactarius indigo]|nr:hypothetical protein H4582DRAFT_2029965 [Lactarius indigo]